MKINKLFLVFSMIFLVITYSFAQKKQWQFQKHYINHHKLQAAMNAQWKKGWTPVGITADIKNNIYVVYVKGFASVYNNWKLAWYVDNKKIKTDLKAKLAKGWIPAGISHVGKYFYVLYLKTKHKLSSWRLVSTELSNNASNKIIASNAKKGYFPVAVTSYKSKIWLLLLKFSKNNFKSWKMESYPADSLIVQNHVNSLAKLGFIPWGVSLRKGNVIVIYLK